MPERKRMTEVGEEEEREGREVGTKTQGGRGNSRKGEWQSKY